MRFYLGKPGGERKGHRLFNFHPQPWTSSISSPGLSCCTHTVRGEGKAEARRRGRLGGIWASCRACAFPEQQVGSTDRGSVRGGWGGRTGAEHGGDVSAPPGRHPARPSRGQREPQRERERRDAPPERRVTITTPHSGRVRAGRDATRAEAPRERPAANVSAASLGGPGAGQAWGRREPACVRSSPLLSCVLEAVAAAAPFGRANPAAASGTADAAEGRSTSRLPPPPSPDPPGKQRLQQDWTRAPGGTEPSSLRPGEPGGERTQLVAGPLGERKRQPLSSFQAPATPGRGPRANSGQHSAPSPPPLGPDASSPGARHQEEGA